MIETATVPQTRRGLRARRRRLSAVNVLVAGMMFVGVCTLLYPTAGDWYSDVAHASELSGYVRDVGEAPDGDLAQELAAAEAYNENLPNGPLRDPYALSASGSPVDLADGYPAYLRQLALTPTSPMARIRIPTIGVDLPVFHGTDDRTLAAGVGHLYGSGLPVGGAGTHAVLTGHSGLPNATLFTHLDELRSGDMFFIDVAGRELAHRIDQTAVVKPDDGAYLRQVAGRDYVTLLTCTPTGVNTHRLLVRGVRVDTATLPTGTVVAAPPTQAGFPWWALALAGAAAGSAAIAWPRRGRAGDRRVRTTGRSRLGRPA